MRFPRGPLSLFRFLVLLVTVVAGAACSQKRGEPDARCSVENCRKLHECRAFFSAEPDCRVCFNAGLVVPSGYDFAVDCPAACEAQNGGRVVECVAQQPACFGLSSSAMLDTVTSCQSSLAGGFSSGQSGSDAGDRNSCEAACDLARVTCENACPTSDFQSCSDCARGCATTFGDCEAQCP